MGNGKIHLETIGMNDAPLTDVTSRIRFPTHRQARNKNDITTLYFPDDVADVLPSGTYSVRGGLSWPSVVVNAGGMDVVGACLSIITHIETQRSVVIDECHFRSVDHVFGNYVTGPCPSAVLERENRGLHEFISRQQHMLGLNTYYYAENEDVHLKWAIALRDCASLPLKPKLIPAPDMPDDIALAHVFQRIAAGKIAYKLQGLVWQALATYAGNAAGGMAGRAPTDPILRALSAASRSISAWPAKAPG